MSVVLEEVNALGYGWFGQSWNYLGAGEPAYISLNNEMTGFRFTAPKRLRQVTITFSVDTQNDNVRWSMTMPTVIGSSAPGTNIVLTAGDNTITVDGDFVAGQTYTLWVWGCSTGGVVQHSLVRSCSGTGEEVEDDGLVNIYRNGAWGKYVPYIWVNGGWKQYDAHVYYGNAWHKMV